MTHHLARYMSSEFQYNSFCPIKDLALDWSTNDPLNCPSSGSVHALGSSNLQAGRVEHVLESLKPLAVA